METSDTRAAVDKYHEERLPRCVALCCIRLHGRSKDIQGLYSAWHKQIGVSFSQSGCHHWAEPSWRFDREAQSHVLVLLPAACAAIIS